MYVANMLMYHAHNCKNCQFKFFIIKDNKNDLKERTVEIVSSKLLQKGYKKPSHAIRWMCVCLFLSMFTHFMQKTIVFVCTSLKVMTHT